MDTITSKSAKLGFVPWRHARGREGRRSAGFYSATLRMACMEKHCASVAPGGSAVGPCIVANFDKLTPECRAGVEAWKKSKEKS